MESLSNMNLNNFKDYLATQYADLFANDPDYAYSAAHCTPEGLAVKMTNSLKLGSGSKDGKAVKAVCKHFKIKNTYSAIREFLNS